MSCRGEELGRTSNNSVGYWTSRLLFQSETLEGNAVYFKQFQDLMASWRFIQVWSLDIWKAGIWKVWKYIAVFIELTTMRYFLYVFKYIGLKSWPSNANWLKLNRLITKSIYLERVQQYWEQNSTRLIGRFAPVNSSLCDSYLIGT